MAKPNEQTKQEFNPMRIYRVTKPSVMLRRCATRLVSRKGDVCELLLTLEIAKSFNVA
jgi:hypothetical protein